MCFNEGRPGRGEAYAATTILRVNKTTFTVNDEAKTRFKLGTQTTPQGGTWGWTRRCVPFDSTEGQAARERFKWRRASNVVRDACEVWQKDSSDANRDALIAALSALPDRPAECEPTSGWI